LGTSSIFLVDSFANLVANGEIDGGAGFRTGGIVAGGSSGNGNINIIGQYQIAGGCVLGCTPATTASPGRAVASYSAQEVSPSIEDFGEAQLVDGRAYVPLSSDFANVIDGHMNYLVFITPEGDNRGLYVSDKTHAGFAVHESQGGRSNLMFSYRIVAKRYGVKRPRLPMVTIPALRSLLHTPHRIADTLRP
jgi:hypothetical protein